MERKDFEELRTMLYANKKGEWQDATFHELLEVMRVKKPDVTIRELLEAKQKLNLRQSRPITPTVAIEFVRAVINKLGCKRLYVPFASGIELEELGTSVSTVDYATPIAEFRNLMEERSGVAAVSDDVVFGSEYDAVYSDLLNYSPIKITGIQEDLVNRILQVSQNGVGIFIAVSSVVFDKRPKSLISILRERGVYLTAVIDLPEGSYSPATQVATRIVLFTRENSENLFLARIDKENNVARIVDNYFAKTVSCNNENGVWIKNGVHDDYASYDHDRRIKKYRAKIERAYGGKLQPLSNIIVSVNRPRVQGNDSKDTNFEDIENAIYISLNGDSEVTTDITAVRKNPHAYIQLVVDQNYMYANFLRLIIISDTFNLLRDYNSFSPLINHRIENYYVDDILKTDVPVPPLKIQDEAIRTLSDIEIIENEVELLKERLLKSPAYCSEVRQDLKEVNSSISGFERWFESLPYPLATILKRYSTCIDNRTKQDLLFFFFEAYSIFSAAILTAVYRNFPDRPSQLQEIDAHCFENACFGNWVKYDKVLAGIFEEKIMSNNDGECGSVLNRFRTDDPDVVKLLCLNDVYTLLDKMNKYRNIWKGHHPYTNDEGYERQVAILSNELKKLQKFLRDLYEKITLVRQINIRRQKGLFINTVEVLSGSNPIFNTVEIIGDEFLEEDKLYIHVVDTNKTFDIPPFLLMKSTPAEFKNACYFYSRLVGSQSQYLSYHFESIPEDFEEGKPALEVLETILARD